MFAFLFILCRHYLIAKSLCFQQFLTLYHQSRLMILIGKTLKSSWEKKETLVTSFPIFSHFLCNSSLRKIGEILFYCCPSVCQTFCLSAHTSLTQKVNIFLFLLNKFSYKAQIWWWYQVQGHLSRSSLFFFFFKNFLFFCLGHEKSSFLTMFSSCSKEKDE